MADDNWQFTVSPYLWAAGISGSTTSALGVDPETEISSHSLLNDLKFGGMIQATAQKGQHGIYTDLMYTDIRTNEGSNPIGSLDSTSKTTVFTLAYDYQVFNNQQAQLDLLVGARYWKTNVALDFTFNHEALPDTARFAETKQWVDPALGIKGRSMIANSQFFVEGGAGIGGFGLGSKLYYEFNANIGYQFTDNISAAVGYRYFDVNYDKNDYVYDIVQQGWLAGVSFSF